jgi:hypothetical protein
MENDYSDRIVKVLKNSGQALDVENVRARANIGNWNTAFNHLLKLLIENKIQGERTSHGWIFWIQQEPPKAKSNSARSKSLPLEYRSLMKKLRNGS